MPRHVNADDRRLDLADTALLIAGADGLDAVTIRRVAQRLGASTSAVTHYVEGRQELLLLAVRRAVDRRIVEGHEVIHGHSGLRAIEMLMEWATGGVGLEAQSAWLSLVAGARSSPDLREVLSTFNAWWDDAVQSACAAATADGDLALPVRLAADLITTVVDGLVLASFEDEAPLPAPRRDAVLRLAFDALRGDALEPEGTTR